MEAIQKPKLGVSLPIAILALILGLGAAYVSVEFTVKLFRSFGNDAHEKQLYVIAALVMEGAKYITIIAGLIYLSSIRTAAKGAYYLGIGVILTLFSILATLGFQNVTTNKTTETAIKSSSQYKQLNTTVVSYQKQIDSLQKTIDDDLKKGYRRRALESQSKLIDLQDRQERVRNQMSGISVADKNVANAMTNNLSDLFSVSNKELNQGRELAVAISLELVSFAMFAICGFFRKGVGDWIMSFFKRYQIPKYDPNLVIAKVKVGEDVKDKIAPKAEIELEAEKKPEIKPSSDGKVVSIKKQLLAKKRDEEWQLLYEDIVERILSRDINCSKNAICKEFKISRPRAGKAIAQMQDAGLIEVYDENKCRLTGKTKES